eukprot:Clim_evm2s67 gene=Clim_evmTU2s67
MDSALETKKREFYASATVELKALFGDERDYVSNTANAAAYIYNGLHDLGQTSVNWVGFYFFRDDKDLILGPFQGRVACQRIMYGKGVCGTCAKTREVQIVQDVHEFPGHIACDERSQSEIVLPLVRPKASDEQNGADVGLLGVMDLDCAEKNGYSEVDAEGLKAINDLLSTSCDWPEHM